MIDIYLRAADQAAIDAALTAAGLLLDAEDTLAPNTWLDRIGQDPQTVTGLDENDAPILATHPGYHANLRLADPLTPDQHTALDPVTIVPPGQPIRVWA